MENAVSRIRCARCAIWLGFLFCFAFSFSSLAQVTVTDTLTDGTGTTYKTAYLHFQLNNCGLPKALLLMIQDIAELFRMPVRCPEGVSFQVSVKVILCAILLRLGSTTNVSNH